MYRSALIVVRYNNYNCNFLLFVQASLISTVFSVSAGSLPLTRFSLLFLEQQISVFWSVGFEHTSCIVTYCSALRTLYTPVNPPAQCLLIARPSFMSLAELSLDQHKKFSPTLLDCHMNLKKSEVFVCCSLQNNIKKIMSCYESNLIRTIIATLLTCGKTDMHILPICVPFQF